MPHEMILKNKWTRTFKNEHVSHLLSVQILFTLQIYLVNHTFCISNSSGAWSSACWPSVSRYQWNSKGPFKATKNQNSDISNNDSMVCETSMIPKPFNTDGIEAKKRRDIKIEDFIWLKQWKNWLRFENCKEIVLMYKVLMDMMAKGNKKQVQNFNVFVTTPDLIQNSSGG